MDGAWLRQRAYVHLGLDADRRGDQAAARAAYASCVAIALWDRPEHVWAEARLRAIDGDQR